MKIMGKGTTTTTTTFAIRHAILLVGIMVSSSDGFSTFTLKQPPSPLQSSFEDYPSPAPDAANCPPDQPIPPPDLGPAPEGYVGGYAESNPNFAYPTTSPDLSSMNMTTNLANIRKLTRQQKIKWPEFTWLSILGDPSSRLYCTFPEGISRMGYDDEGKVWSIICPQLGAYGNPMLGELNIEVTVTGVRGWTKETKDTERSSCIDIGVMVQFWLSSDDQTSPFFKVLVEFMNEHAQGQLPLEKSKAIQIETSERNNLRQPLSRVSKGMNPDISVPLEKQHWDEAYAVINLSIQINKIKSVDNQLDIVTDFNHLLIDIFNLNGGNMMKPGNILSWNIWFQEPELVDKVEWKTHAERYRKSVDVRPTNSIGPNTASSFTNFNGVITNPVKDDLQNEIELIKVFFAKHVNGDDLAKYKHRIELVELEYQADKALKKIKKIL